MGNRIVPEFAVSDWRQSKRFYCDLLGFECLYERPEEGFCYLSREGAELMIDQIGLGRTFDNGHGPWDYPLGRGLNVQIEVSKVFALAASLRDAGLSLFLELEEKWYRQGEGETGVLQFVVADPDGYLLRFFEPLGFRTV